jgi:hypothetical protein
MSQFFASVWNKKTSFLLATSSSRWVVCTPHRTQVSWLTILTISTVPVCHLICICVAPIKPVSWIEPLTHVTYELCRSSLIPSSALVNGVVVGLAMEVLVTVTAIGSSHSVILVSHFFNWAPIDRGCNDESSSNTLYYPDGRICVRRRHGMEN